MDHTDPCKNTDTIIYLYLHTHIQSQSQSHTQTYTRYICVDIIRSGFQNCFLFRERHTDERAPSVKHLGFVPIRSISITDNTIEAGGSAEELGMAIWPQISAPVFLDLRHFFREKSQCPPSLGWWHTHTFCCFTKPEPKWKIQPSNTTSEGNAVKKLFPLIRSILWFSLFVFLHVSDTRKVRWTSQWIPMKSPYLIPQQVGGIWSTTLLFQPAYLASHNHRWWRPSARHPRCFRRASSVFWSQWMGARWGRDDPANVGKTWGKCGENVGDYMGRIWGLIIMYIYIYVYYHMTYTYI